MSNASQLAAEPSDQVTPGSKPGIPLTLQTVVAVTLLGALGWWAFKPLPEVKVDAPAEIPAATQVPEEPMRLALDLSAFRAPLWIAPPAPPPPAPAPKPEPPLPPLRLQILAIVRDGDGDRALLYDPDTDKPIWVRSGQTVGPRTVERVTADAVELREQKVLRTLALRTDRSDGSLLERTLRTSGGGR